MAELTDYEKMVLADAEYFTAVRGRDPSTRIRKRFDTLDEATMFGGNGDGRTMVYAVTAQGRSAHICNV